MRSGTASGDGERLVKSGLLQAKVVGKYDRRVEYLMLRKMRGPPRVTVFEYEIPASVPEQARRRCLYGHLRRGSACLRGFRAEDRDGIEREVLDDFRHGDISDADARTVASALETTLGQTLLFVRLAVPYRVVRVASDDILLVDLADLRRSSLEATREGARTANDWPTRRPLRVRGAAAVADRG